MLPAPQLGPAHWNPRRNAPARARLERRTGCAAQALPFLAELLEDPEPDVAAGARSLCRRLEALSGESLEPYLHG